MKYNLLDLSIKQIDLDSYIHRLHDVNYETTRVRRLLAFLVELGELANETRCFKFWSLKGPSPDDVVFEEYVDGIHFLLSLGHAIKYDYHKEMEVIVLDCDLTDYFLKVYNLASNFDYSDAHFEELFGTFLGLGVKLGMDFNKLCEVYLKKWKINVERQENKY